MGDETHQTAALPTIRAVADAAGRMVANLGYDPHVGAAWIVLYLAGEPLSADEVARTLGIKRGAAREHLRQLRAIEAARRVQQKGDLRDRFEAETDLWRVITNVLRQREIPLLDDTITRMRRARDQIRDAAASPNARVEKVQLDRIERLLALGLLGRTAMRTAAASDKPLGSMMGALKL
jgi:HTH-type transcriptional regulator, glycine betaine synthesis regulator